MSERYSKGRGKSWGNFKIFERKRLPKGETLGFPWKGQTSFEFLALVMVVMLFSVAVYAGAFGRLSDSLTAENRFDTQSLCRSIAENARFAKIFGNGFSMNITLPQGDYNASVLDSTLICSRNKDVFMEAMFGNVTNSSGSSSFELKKRGIKIENVMDTIVIS